jgi:hypothetical protein
MGSMETETKTTLVGSSFTYEVVREMSCGLAGTLTVEIARGREGLVDRVTTGYRETDGFDEGWMPAWAAAEVARLVEKNR